jgi:hypothetical protein
VIGIEHMFDAGRPRLSYHPMALMSVFNPLGPHAVIR